MRALKKSGLLRKIGMAGILSVSCLLFCAVPALADETAEDQQTAQQETAAAASGTETQTGTEEAAGSASDGTEGSSDGITVIYSGSTGASENGPGTAGWRQDEHGWWYRHADGGYTADAWEEINGKWYHFDAEGYMQADCVIDDGGKRYRLGPDGDMLVSQEIEADGVRYTIDENGVILSEQTAADAAKSESELAAESIAAGIAAQITNSSMTKRQKASAIYSWVRGNMTYSHSGPKGDPAEGALYGFRRRYGNCYEYYAVSKYLLEACDMPNIMVTRASDGDHFWNLVNVDGAWYHFDTCPRRTGGSWCLVTTGSLQRSSWGAHNFNISAYPSTP